jgi:NAD(P)-dependent dehydrogenase (short-subunit alcohol dehydrogenase family)
VHRAAAKIVRLELPLAGLVNNAGIMQLRPTKNARGWDMSYATNHLGPFVLTEALMPHLRDGANIVFVVSAVEDPERKPAVSAGFRGARYISAEASARGDWEPGGFAKPGFDAYATSKQAILAAALELARETPRLHIDAIEPGFNPSTGLGAGDANAFVRFVQKFVVPLIVPLLMPFIKILSTSKRAARKITKILIDTSGHTGVYYDEGGRPMQGSVLVRDPKFQDRVVAETLSLPNTQNEKPSQQSCFFRKASRSTGQGKRITGCGKLSRDPQTVPVSTVTPPMRLSTGSDHSSRSSEAKLFGIEFSNLHVSKEHSVKPRCDQLDSQLFEAEYLADENSVLVPADVAAIVDSSQQETLRVRELWQLAWQSDRDGDVETCGNLVVQALMRALVIEHVAKVIEAALLSAKGCGRRLRRVLL